MNAGKTIYDCGCSHLKVKLGTCDHYDANGNQRINVPDERKLCRSAVLDMANQFAMRSAEAQLTADKLRENDTSSYVEHEAIASTWSCASALLSELAGGQPSEVEPLHPIIVGEMLWSVMNERRCELISKDVHEKGLSPERKVELAGLEAVLDARCALITALERMTPKGLDALATAFADFICNRQTPLDIETRGLMVKAIQALSRKKLIGRLTYEEEALLARCINRLERDPMRNSFVPSDGPANECSDAERTQYEITIEQQKERIAELEKQLADDLNNSMTIEIESDDVKEVIAERDELLKRVKELQTDVVSNCELAVRALREVRQFVDASAYAHDHDRRCNADAVIMIIDEKIHRHHGDKLPDIGDGDALLQRVRTALDANDVSVGGEHRAVLYPVWTRIIDEELAALAPVPK